MFLRRLVPGPADRSYGIEVARLAGVPKSVVDRAREILAKLEEKSQDNQSKGAVERASQTLLPGFGAPPIVISGELTEHPIVTQLIELDVDGMTPIQALMLLNQWKDMVKE